MAEPRLLLTRPEPAARRFLAALEMAAGRHLPAVISPLMRIDAFTPPPPDTAPAALVLTSERGAEGAARMGYAGLPAWCVGTRTAEAAERVGLSPRAAGGDAASLVAMILESGETGPFLHLRGAHARGDVAARLSAAGRPCAERVVYDQTARPLTAEAQALLDGAAPVVAPLFSPRSARLFARHAPFAAPLALAAMSGAVAEALAGLPGPTLTAARPDQPAMIDATLRALATFGPGGASRPGGA
ncbi:uroporphyrinogen-III synthase [Limimaricola pyoseonensis]|uniref:Uroporphyrinogen-III synthase n=1 Tax=Limimaricola pyoseonensis TaxID=521013 RepID=A0A1G7EKH2_9RHOB|nr:uroporphyrinogen-III synthase [Limimaricola pyoseonensis]SDE63886.1 uroporphyrinogen-III synthase [Limimaricola pyoseonensis]